MGIEMFYPEEQTDREITKILFCFWILPKRIKSRFETGNTQNLTDKIQAWLAVRVGQPVQ
jgi:hypothetical protein